MKETEEQCVAINIIIRGAALKEKEGFDVTPKAGGGSIVCVRRFFAKEKLGGSNKNSKKGI